MAETGPTTYPELIETLRQSREIEPDEAHRFLDNFSFLESHRDEIQPTAERRWVASVDRHFEYDSSLGNLRSRLLKEYRNGRYAYIEQIA